MFFLKFQLPIMHRQFFRKISQNPESGEISFERFK